MDQYDLYVIFHVSMESKHGLETRSSQLNATSFWCSVMMYDVNVKLVRLVNSSIWPDNV